ncbi:DgyrCDS5046 [Dimorphilus gyrociliatus]|uniref:DgyrCDS5046 n=1 Tax=Dimorphilus gyrociliatus TaxID=2664684 RepID=A0A7I8VIT2_9ANNE|nr:DgyrCDS5046 [Dimorphilus gyrociliatus]
MDITVFFKKSSITVNKLTNIEQRTNKQRTTQTNKYVHELFDTAENMNKVCEELVNHKDIEGATALHLAIQNQQYETIKFLLDKGANVMERKENGVTALHLASAQGLTAVVSLILDYYAIIDCVDLEDCTPLHRASQYNHVKTLEVLLQRGASANRKDRDGLLPIHLAAWKGQVDAVKFLLERTDHENIYEIDVFDKTALHWAVENGQYECAVILIKYGRTRLIQMKDYSDMSALHYAAKKGNLDILKLMLSNNAEVGAKDRDERASLHYAAKYGHYECVKALLDKSGQETNDSDVDGRTPLHLACLSGHNKILSLLLSHGADLSNRDDHYCTPLMLASATGHTSTIQLLLLNHADVLANDRLKNTSLHYACANGHVQIVLALLDARADVTVRNSQNQTPLDISIENFQQEVAITMLKHRCWRECMEMKDEVGMSPLEKLIIKLPEAAKILLDNTSQKSNLDDSDPSLTVLYDFRYLDPGPDELNQANQRYYALKTMATYRREKLLSHPICQANMAYKWNSFGRKMCAMNVLFYIVYLTVLYLHAKGNLQARNGTDCYPNITSDTFYLTAKQDFLISTRITQALLFILVIISCCREMLTIYQQKLASLVIVDNWCAIAVIISTILFTIHNKSPCEYYRRSGWITIFFVWLNLTLYLRRVPYIGIYIIMFLQVLASLMKAVLMFLFFLLAFSMCFHVIIEKDHSEINPFRDMITTLYQVFIMTLGEIDFQDDFLKKFKKFQPFDTDVYFLLAIFLFIMPVVLMNLLIGIAVGDIGQIQANAHVQRLSMQVDLLGYTENMLPGFLQRRVYKRQLQVQPNKSSLSFLERLGNFLSGKDNSKIKVASPEGEEIDFNIQNQITRQTRSIRKLEEEVATVNKQLKEIVEHFDKDKTLISYRGDYDGTSPPRRILSSQTLSPTAIARRKFFMEGGMIPHS